jgi:peptide deformylase
MILPIVTIPADSLRIRSQEVDRKLLLSDDMQDFIDAMIPTMYDDDGIGLAAPQVAKNVRICVVGKEADASLSHDLVLVNPTWERTSRKKGWDTEGCLSVPNVYGKVQRFRDIHVKALDRDGNMISFDARKYFARVIQHEVDHLDGILFIDKAKDTYEVDASQQHPVDM